MAGHSKWHNIQHRKGAQDAKRGKVFTKLIKEIVVAAKMGGGVIENNPSLRAIIDKALAANMKRDTIDNAVKRGAGDLDGDNYEEVRYEGYGLGGTAIMEVAIEYGADDVITNDDGSIDVMMAPDDFFSIKDALVDNNLNPEHSQITMEPDNRIELNLEDAEKFMKLIDRLESLDDTQEVYHNADISDEVMAQL